MEHSIIATYIQLTFWFFFLVVVEVNFCSIIPAVNHSMDPHTITAPAVFEGKKQKKTIRRTNGEECLMCICAHSTRRGELKKAVQHKSNEPNRFV